MAALVCAAFRLLDVRQNTFDASWKTFRTSRQGAATASDDREMLATLRKPSISIKLTSGLTVYTVYTFAKFSLGAEIARLPGLKIKSFC